MADDDLFPLLNIIDTEDIDCNAIINSINRNPQLAAKKYDFSNSFNFTTYRAEYRAFPLHQAIKLRANIDVVEALYNCYPQAIKDKSSGSFADGDTALHFALRNRAPIDVVLFVFHKWPEAAREMSSVGRFPLHDACDGSFPIEVVSLLLDTWPNSVWEKDGDSRTPLHLACDGVTRHSSAEVVSLLMQKYPGAAMEIDTECCTPLHYACHCDAPIGLVPLLMESGPGAVMVKDEHGMTPLQRIFFCGFSNETFDKASLILTKYPAAARDKDERGNTPLHNACCFDAPLNVILMLLEHFPEAAKKKNEDGETPLDLYKEYVSFASDVEKVLSYVLQLCEDKMDNGSSTLREMVGFFTEIEWWNGIAMILDRCPFIYKDLEFDINIFPQFLSFVGRRCLMKMMWHVISNELDIIEGA